MKKLTPGPLPQAVLARTFVTMEPMSSVARLSLALVLVSCGVALKPNPLRAEPVPVRQKEGLIHGFLLLRASTGDLLATGDWTQVANGDRVTSILAFRFKDGSIHEETAVFSQRRLFRLLTYHLAQRGPAFKRPTDMNLNVSTGQVTVHYTDDGKDKTVTEHLTLPADVANGIVSTLMHDLDPKSPRTELSMVVSAPKPRLVKLVISPEGDDAFSIGGATHKATRYVVKIELGGITGIVAPIVGKRPPDTRVWMLGGSTPAFLRSEGPLCDECPIWRIELASPVWPKGDTDPKP